MKLLALLFVLSSLPCFARLGETEAQCIARYGDEWPLREDYGRAVVARFQKDGFELAITFLDGKAVQIFFTKPDDKGFEDAELTAIMDKNSEGKQWKLEDSDIGVWDRSDKAKAVYSSNVFNISEPNANVAADIVAAGRAKKTTSGL